VSCPLLLAFAAGSLPVILFVPVGVASVLLVLGDSYMCSSSFFLYLLIGELMSWLVNGN
jgi:hypothetical protein